MQEKIRTYYRGERITNALFMAYGAACIGFGVLFYLYAKSELSLGLLYGLGLLGGIQFAIGIVRLWRTFRLFEYSKDSINSDQSYLKNVEYNRVNKLDSKYQKMRIIHTGIFLVSFAAIIICALTDYNDFMLGTGAALTLHSAVLLTFDLFSQFRTREYLYQIEKLKS